MKQGRSIFPLLLVDWVEWEGPILSDADRKKREGLIPAKDGDLAEAHMKQLFTNGRLITRSHAVKELMEITGLKHTTCYTALSPKGRFKDWLREEGKLLSWVE